MYISIYIEREIVVHTHAQKHAHASINVQTHSYTHTDIYTHVQHYKVGQWCTLRLKAQGTSSGRERQGPFLRCLPPDGSTSWIEV